MKDFKNYTEWPNWFLTIFMSDNIWPTADWIFRKLEFFLERAILLLHFCFIIKLISPKVDTIIIRVQNILFTSLDDNKNMSFSKIIDSVFLSIRLCFSLSLFTLNLDLKVSEEPHVVHLEAKTAGEHSGQHSGELFNRKQVLLSFSPHTIEDDQFYFWTRKYIFSDTLQSSEYDPQHSLLSSHTTCLFMLKAF